MTKNELFYAEAAIGALTMLLFMGVTLGIAFACYC